MKLLVVIPALNEEKNIGKVIKAVPKKIRGFFKIKTLVVDDGSTDKTAKVARLCGAEVINQPFNIGVGAAFDRGLQYAIEKNFDVMVNIDGDGQFNPQDIKKLVRPIQNKQADFVTASRFIDKGFRPEIPQIKLWGNKTIAYLINKLTGRKFSDVSCGFRVYSREAMLSLNLTGEFTYAHEVFLDLVFKKLRILEVPVKVKYFNSRRSRVFHSPLSYGLKALKIILQTYRDYKPLKFFLGVGGFLFLIAIFFGSILLGTFLTRGTFSPNIWSGFIGAVFLFIAIIFFIIGVLADMNTRTRLNQEKILYYLRKQSVKTSRR